MLPAAVSGSLSLAACLWLTCALLDADCRSQWQPVLGSLPMAFTRTLLEAAYRCQWHSFIGSMPVAVMCTLLEAACRGQWHAVIGSLVEDPSSLQGKPLCAKKESKSCLASDSQVKPLGFFLVVAGISHAVC